MAFAPLMEADIDGFEHIDQGDQPAARARPSVSGRDLDDKSTARVAFRLCFPYERWTRHADTGPSTPMIKIRRKHSRRHLARRILGEIRQHPANSRRETRAILRAIGWQLRKRIPRADVRVHAYGMDLRLPRASGSLSNLFYFGDAFEWQAVNFVRAYCREGDSIIDAGANIGMFTYMACQVVGVDGKVVAFEPLAEYADVIRANVKRNGFDETVDVYAVATSDSSGSVTFTDDVDVSNHITHASTDAGRSTRTVPTRRIDDVVSTPPSLIKLDVEGAETQALRGCAELFATGARPVIILEIHDHSLRSLGSSRDELVSRLDELGYCPVDYDVSTGAVTASSWSISTEDQICVPAADLKQVRDRLHKAVA